MKFLLVFFVTLLGCIVTTMGQTRCSSNADPAYNRHETLEQLASILNRSIPEYKTYLPELTTNGERAAGFFVRDLSDLNNFNLPRSDKCVDFINHHVYYFSPIDYSYSLGFIVILENKTLKTYLFTDCPGGADKIEEVVAYVRSTTKYNTQAEDIVSRLKDRRQLGAFVRVDEYAKLRCGKS